MRTLYTFPYWKSNPYLTILHTGAAWAGWTISGGTTLDDLTTAVDSLASGDVLHVHWTAPVCTGARDESDAKRRLRQFRRALKRASESNVTVLWTVHNELPHELAFRAEEIAAARALIRHASSIVQLHQFTANAVAETYRLPDEKLETLYHSSYQGIYPDEVDRDAARDFLGVDGQAGVVGYVGQIRPYKGVLDLLDAMSVVARENTMVELVLAGKTRPEDILAIERRLPRGVRTVRQHSFVPDEQLQYWFTASDVLVFPYQKVLNSGSVLLAATFGRPCILPADTPLRDVYRNEPWVLFYGGGSDYPTLASAITAALALPVEVQESAREFAASRTPFGMARGYAAILERAVGRLHTGEPDLPGPIDDRSDSEKESA